MSKRMSNKKFKHLKKKLAKMPQKDKWGMGEYWRYFKPLESGEPVLSSKQYPRQLKKRKPLKNDYKLRGRHIDMVITDELTKEEK